MVDAINRRIDMIIVHAWESLNETFEARASEWILGAVMVSLSIVTMLNVDLFQGVEFRVLKTFMTQESWALVFLVTGFTRIVALIINGAWWRTPHIRSIIAFICGFVWFQLSLGFASDAGFGLAVFPWLFLLDSFNALRAGREAGMAQFLRKYKKGNASHGLKRHHT